MVWSPHFCRLAPEGGGTDVYVVGHPLVDDFLEFAGGRARPNTVRAYAHDLKTFFSVVGKEPVDVRAADVMAFIRDQRRGRSEMTNVVRMSNGSAGLSNATIRRRLAAVSAFYGYLVARGDVGVDTNPVPRGLPTRRRRRDGHGQPLVRSVRRLPRILEAEEVTALMGALRTQRDRAMVQAMLLGGLRRCEVLGLRLQDLHLGEWRVFVNEGKGAISGWCRCRRRSSGRSRHTWTANDHKASKPIASSSSSRGRAGVSPCRPRAWTRSSVAPGPVPGSTTAPATSCATRASRGCGRRA